MINHEEKFEYLEKKCTELKIEYDIFKNNPTYYTRKRVNQEIRELRGAITDFKLVINNLFLK